MVNVRTAADGRPEYYHTNVDGTKSFVTGVQTTPNGEFIYELDNGTTIRADDYARYRQAQEYIYQEMTDNRGSFYFDVMADSKGSGLLSYLMLRQKARTGGDWDHKPELQAMFGAYGDDDLYFPVPEPGGHRKIYYDIYSNIHYGYIGAEAGIAPEVLIQAANLNTGATGVNDPGDDIAMRAGIKLSQQHGDNITQAQVNETITDVINQIDTAQQNGAPTHQVRYR